MMKNNKLFVLLKYYLSMDFNIFHFKGFLKDKKQREKLIQILFLIALTIYLGYLALDQAKTIAQMINDSANLEIKTLILNAIFIFSFLIYVSNIYQFMEKSQDTVSLLSLPIKAGDIILAKLGALSCSNLVFFYSIPTLFLATLGYYLGKGIDYYIMLAVGVVSMNIFMACLFGTICTALYKLIISSKLLKKFAKTTFIIIYILFIILIYLFIFLGSKSLGYVGVVIEYLKQLNFLTAWFYDALMAQDFSTRLFSLGIGLLITGNALVVFKLIAYSQYESILKHSISGSSQTINAKKLSRLKEKTLDRKKRSIFMTLMSKEIKYGFIPTFFLNNFIITILLLVVYLGGLIYFLFFLNPEMVFNIRYGLKYNLNDETVFRAIIFTAHFLAFYVNIQGASLHSLNREGRNLWLTACMPVSIHKQIWVKALFAAIFPLTFIFIVLVTSPLIHVFAYQYYLVFTGLFILIYFTSSFINSAIGFAFPKVDWINPVEVTKNSKGPIIAIFANYILMFVGGMAIAKLHDYNYSLPIIYSLYIGVLLVLFAISYYLTYYFYRKCITNL